MAFCYDNLKLDKGMYQEAGSTFTQVLERQDPSDQYKGTSLEGLDAFQWQRRSGKVFPNRRFRRPLSRVHRPVGPAGYGGERHSPPHHRRCDPF